MRLRVRRRPALAGMLMAAAGLLAMMSGAAADIGYAEALVTDPVTDAPAPVMIWYPSDAPAAPVRRGPFVMRVAVDAEPAPGRHGLVVFSHGSGGAPLAHHGTAEALAAAGWIVAAPMHPGDDVRNASGAGSAVAFIGRVRTLSAVIDRMLGDPRFAGHVDAGRIAAVGYSAGGAAVLALAGAPADAANAVAFCADHGAEDTLCGRYGVRADLVVEASRIGPVPADDRLDLAIALMPVTGWFADDALAHLQIPVRIMTSQHDEMLPPPLHGERLAAGSDGAVPIEVMVGAGHFFPLGVLPDELAGSDVARDPAGLDRAAAIARLNDWLIRTLDDAIR
ncbi:hypothetical protein WG926_03720 [Tistrella sp. BH-R2-4]|uniref:Dienelactone hydrolase n=1 Tax=Tistrella arctica TaxID=3133430 RepID=A0ABU9YF49_9PROT